MSTNKVTARGRLHSFKDKSQNLASAQQAVLKAFWQLHKRTTTVCVLDRKTKELIALAISVVMR